MKNGIEAKENYMSDKIVKAIANIVSYIFHPIFIPVYVFLFLVYVHPTLFAGFSGKQKFYAIIIAVQNFVFYPLLSVLLLKMLGFVDSIFLRTRRDRIIPYIACGIFFFWAYTVFKNQEEYPKIVTSFAFGVFLASCLGFFANIYFKISMHAIGVGGMLALFLIMVWEGNIQMAWPVALAVFITGAVCTARMLISNHTQDEIYTGLCVGLISQIAAAYML